MSTKSFKAQKSRKHFYDNFSRGRGRRMIGFVGSQRGGSSSYRGVFRGTGFRGRVMRGRGGYNRGAFGNVSNNNNNNNKPQN